MALQKKFTASLAPHLNDQFRQVIPWDRALHQQVAHHQSRGSPDTECVRQALVLFDAPPDGWIFHVPQQLILVQQQGSSDARDTLGAGVTLARQQGLVKFEVRVLLAGGAFDPFEVAENLDQPAFSYLENYEDVRFRKRNAMRMAEEVFALE